MGLWPVATGRVPSPHRIGSPQQSSIRYSPSVECHARIESHVVLNQISELRSPPETAGEPSSAGRRPYLLPLLGGGAFIISVIVSLIGWAILHGRADAHHTAEITTANLSQILADNFNSAIRQVDLGMLSILDEVARQQASGHREDGALRAALARQDSRHPGLLGFRVYGSDGKLRTGVSNIVNPNSDLSQRDDFKILRDMPTSAMVVTPPVFGPAVQQWVISLGRRITNPDGSFGGAVYSAIPVKALAQSFASVDLGPGGTVALYHTSFKIAARFSETKGPNDPVGLSITDDRLRAIIASGAPTAQYDYTSPIDGIRRTAHVRRIEGQPYYLLVGQAEDGYLADWRRNSVYLMVFGGFMVGLVLWGMRILHRRMSDWRRATAALTESEEKLRGLFQLSPLGIARTSLDGRFVEFNDAFRDITGYDGDELKALDYWALTPRSYAADEARQMASLQSTGRYGPYEKDCVRKDGSLVPLQVRGMLMAGHDGRPYVWSLVEDITARREHERQLMFYRNLIEYSADCVYVISPSQGFRMVFVNDATCRHYGVGREELLRWRVPDWDPNFTDLSSLEVLWRETRDKKNVQVVTSHRVASGRLVPVEISSNYLIHDGEEFIAGYFRDISDRIAAETAMREKTEALSQSNADLEQFAYVASHDLQTPLRNIVSYAQLLDRRYKGRLDADADDFIGFIVDSSKQMTWLITDLLEYSRVASQSKPLRPTSAGEAVVQVLANLKLEIDTAGADVTVGDLPQVLAEPSHLVSLFQNLLGNGIKYRAPDRKPLLSVTAERMAPDLWRFAVADNGIGIESAYHDKIFEIFQRLYPNAETDGTGIGLTLCRRIVHRLGGSIWVDSTPGAGTTIYFTIKDASA